jgi:hypothetical protein
MDLNALCHTLQSLEKLPDLHRELVADLATAIHSAGYDTPLEARHQIWKTFMKMKIEVPNEIFEKMEPDDSVEAWTSDLRFLFAMGPILKVTSYSLEELATISWASLFQRDIELQKKIVADILDAVITRETHYNTADWHLVRENFSEGRQHIMVKIKQITPFYSSTGLSGVFALVKSKRPDPGWAVDQQSV